jgi:hypothetical protein
MFRVEFFCDDKRLSSALHALVGISHGAPTVHPVVNAMKSGNGLAAKFSGNTLERLPELLKPFKGKQITANAHGPELMKALGLNPTSKTYLFRRAVEAKMLKPTGKGSGMKYLVL